MGLAQGFVNPTPKVTENHQIGPQYMECVRMPTTFYLDLAVIINNGGTADKHLAMFVRRHSALILPQNSI